MKTSSVGNVLVGSVVSAILFAVPGGPAIGAGIAGYLEAEKVGHGAVVGAIVGLGSATVVVISYAVFFQTILAPGTDPRLLQAELGTSLLLVLFVYSVVLSVGGGLLGSYIQARTTVSSDVA